VVAGVDGVDANRFVDDVEGVGGGSAVEGDEWEANALNLRRFVVGESSESTVAAAIVRGAMLSTIWSKLTRRIPEAVNSRQMPKIWIHELGRGSAVEVQRLFEPSYTHH
jgi:hypothetical protein